MSGLSGFTSVKKTGAIWEPKQIGKSGDDDHQVLKAGDDSYMIGWYLETDHSAGKSGNSTIHKFKLKEVGNDSHVQGNEMVNNEISVWGSKTLDDDLLTNVQPGECVAIVWKGKQKAKQGGPAYHVWDVMKDPSIAPIPVDGGMPGAGATPLPSDMNAKTPPETRTVASSNSMLDDNEEEDDMPF